MKNVYTLNTNLDKYASGDSRQALVDLFDIGYLQEDPSNRPNSPRVSYRLTFQAEGILRDELSKRDNPESSGENEQEQTQDDSPSGNEGWEHPEWDN